MSLEELLYNDKNLDDIFTILDTKICSAVYDKALCMLKSAEQKEGCEFTGKEREIRLIAYVYNITRDLVMTTLLEEKQENEKSTRDALEELIKKSF